MSSANTTADQFEKPTLALIQQIKDGTVHPKALNKEERQRCVVMLWLEGYSYQRLAQLLNVSEKTAQRDIGDFRAKNAVAPNIELAKQVVGELFVKFANHHARLTRLARSGEGSIGDRTQAEYLAWKTVKEFVETLQSLGYLPQQPQQVVGDVMHRVSTEDGNCSLEEINQTIQEVVAIGEGTGTRTPEIAQRIQELQDRLEKARLSQEARKLLEQQKQLNLDQEATHEQPE